MLVDDSVYEQLASTLNNSSPLPTPDVQRLIALKLHALNQPFKASFLRTNPPLYPLQLLLALLILPRAGLLCVGVLHVRNPNVPVEFLFARCGEIERVNLGFFVFSLFHPLQGFLQIRNRNPGKVLSLVTGCA